MYFKFSFLNQVKKNNFFQIIDDEEGSISKNDLINNINKISNFFHKKKKIIFFPENNIKSITLLLSFIYNGSKIFILNDDNYLDDIDNLIGKFKPQLIIGNFQKIKFLKKKIKNLKYFNNFLTYDGKFKNCFLFENLIKNKISKKLNIKKNIKAEIICSTSGTTGFPKKIHFMKDNFISRAINSNSGYKIKKGKFLITTPFYHSLALKCLFMALLSKNKIILMNNFTTFKCKRILKKNDRIIWHTSSSQIKEMIINFNKQFINNKNIISIISCADSLDKKFKIMLKNAKYDFFDTYGCAETDGISSVLINTNVKDLNTVGKVNKSHKVKILINKKLTELPNKIGEICARTKLICNKINDKLQNKNFFFKNYYKTGDLGYFDKKKNLFITGRKKNLIIISGVNLYPERIENILRKNNKIKNAAVIGGKSLEKGQSIVAFISTIKKITEIEVINYLMNKIPSFCLPKKIYILKKIPTNEIGKVDRYKLHSYLNQF